MDSLSISDPRRVPTLPLRPSGLVGDGINHGTYHSKSTKDIADTWNAWADCVEKVFQQMGNQTEELEVSEDQYISFIHMFASHPARPTLRPLEITTGSEDWVIRTMSYNYINNLRCLWTTYADKLEGTYVSIAAELGRCNLLSCPFESTSTRGCLHGILRSMMGPGRLFQSLADTPAVAEMSLQGPWISQTDQLASRIENMSLCGELPSHIEGAEGLTIRLRNMNIEAGVSRID